ncbi:Imm59 family immunity protein [Neobacillus sp. 179-C4.2 HS]|uniref:Imm59 family immunity protein n=1 Tax=Neobacillus driksii TaxID=3035913 RepID=A0ABV4YSR1_9BACI|nr:Imm59 family immunity protein [Neobacillus sp. 179.-C4.2 HS]MDP5195148.1 Imm59 family immunity protein [Neobacillus sp. 179.-C4.2 HS]
MRKENALKIIQNEKLQNLNWFDDHKIKPNEVGIREKANKWKVYTSDERANPISEKEFQTEGEALKNFIKRLRALNKIQNL